MTRRLIYAVVLVVLIAGWLAFHFSRAHNDRGPDALGIAGMGMMIAAIVAGIALRAVWQNQDSQIPTAFEDMPAAFELETIGNRLTKILKSHFPDEFDKIGFALHDDYKVHEIRVLLAGEIGRKLDAPFPGDTSGAWMLTSEEQERLTRMRSVIATFIQDARSSIKPDALIIFDPADTEQA